MVDGTMDSLSTHLGTWYGFIVYTCNVYNVYSTHNNLLTE